MDILDIIKKEHREVAKMLDEAEETDPGDKRLMELARDIEYALSTHVKIEERLFYARLRDRAEDDEKRVDVYEAYTEHDVANHVMNLLRSGRAPDEKFKAELQVLGESVKHHVKEEESTVFSIARELIDRVEREQLGEQSTKARQRADAQAKSGAPSARKKAPRPGAQRRGEEDRDPQAQLARGGLVHHGGAQQCGRLRVTGARDRPPAAPAIEDADARVPCATSPLSTKRPNTVTTLARRTPSIIATMSWVIWISSPTRSRVLSSHFASRCSIVCRALHATHWPRIACAAATYRRPASRRPSSRSRHRGRPGHRVGRNAPAIARSMCRASSRRPITSSVPRKPSAPVASTSTLRIAFERAQRRDDSRQRKPHGLDRRRGVAARRRCRRRARSCATRRATASPGYARSRTGSCRQSRKHK